MQSLGLSDSTPRTESRWRALFWPTIRNDGDLDYITEQGFWVCFIVAAVNLAFSFFLRSIFLGSVESLFFFLAGVGVRQRSRMAGVIAFLAYLLSALVLQRYTGNGFGFVRIVFLALLLANIRGVWLSSRLPIAEDAGQAPVRLNKTIFDKLSDQLPSVLWPKAKWLFYFLAVVEITLLLVSLLMPMSVPETHGPVSTLLNRVSPGVVADRG